MSKQKENEFRIETEIAKNLAKYWYEKCEEKAGFYTNEDQREQVIFLKDLASILDQLPEPEKQPEVKGVDGYVLMNGEPHGAIPYRKPLHPYFVVYNNAADLQLFGLPGGAPLDYLLKEGWKIRPVRLQFLDEQPDITAAELVSQLEEWCQCGASQDDHAYNLLSYAKSLLQKRKV